MANDTRTVRVEEQLKIKIGEAKNLPGRGQHGSQNNSVYGSQGGGGGCVGPQSLRDVYCTVALDQEEISRTPIVERTLTPFFGEEYQFQIPRKFRYLSIYVWDRDPKHAKQDRPVGKIAIKREELHTYNHKDHWFSLRPVNADSEVQGMVRIAVAFEDAAPATFSAATLGNLKRKSTALDGDASGTGNELKENSADAIVSSSSPSASIGRSQSVKASSSSSTLGARTRQLFGGQSSDLTAWTSNDHQHHSSGTSSAGIHSAFKPIGIHPAQSHQHRIYTTDMSSSSSSASAAAAQSPPPPSSPTPSEFTAKSRVAISVLQCAELTKKNGCCDPYAIVRATYSNKKTIVKRTKVRKKTVNPVFDETVHFDLTIDASLDGANTAGSSMNHSSTFKLGGGGSSSHSTNSYSIAQQHQQHHHHQQPPACCLDGADLCEVAVSLWHDVGLSGDAIFLGELKMPMRGRQQQAAVQPCAWYFLQPRTSQSKTSRSCATPPGTRLSADNKLGDNTLGSMRLQLVYTADYVFPLANYDALLNMLLSSLEQRPITATAVYILGEIISNKTEVAQPLVRIFTHQRRIAPMIKALADHEISKLTDATTIFRGNTLVSKMMDEAMRAAGLHYLHGTLRPIVELIVAERKPCEIDPMRVKDASQVDVNLGNLQEYVGRVLDSIIFSADFCPVGLCEIFHDLREVAAKHFPANREVRYSVVSGFIFLRFFAPAILGPKLFDLTQEPLDAQTARTLTLISKTIQALGNLVSSRSALQPSKEPYTGQLYERFCTTEHVDKVKDFLDRISSVDGYRGVARTHGQPVLLKEGLMTKRSQMRKRFGRRNFKQRYFRLTSDSLSYAKAKGKRTICDIPLSEIVGVERLSEDNFKMQHVFQIIRKDRSMYVQTANCVEEKEWVDLLSKICENNSSRVEHYHSQAYIDGEWTCCHDPVLDAQGCCENSPSPARHDMQLANTPDPARDLQRLNTLILHRLHLKDVGAFPAGTFEDPDQSRRTLAALLDTSLLLDQDYRKYRMNLTRDMRYGSFQAPIGDDNYLHMSGFGGLAAMQTAAAAAAAAVALANNQKSLQASAAQQQQQQQQQQRNQQQQQHHQLHHHQMTVSAVVSPAMRPAVTLYNH